MSQMNARNLLCPICHDAEENEIHFILSCPGLNQVREQLLPRKYFRDPCLFRLVLLLASPNHNIVKSLAVYLYKAFKIRAAYTS